MGFFSDLLGVVAPIAGALIGGPIGAGIGATAAGLLAPTGTPAAATALATGRVAPAGGSPFAPGQLATIQGQQVAQKIIAVGGGPLVTTGRMRKRTTVETFDPVTGVVSKRLTFDGGVAVRSADVAAFKRVFRQVTKISAKLPRKLIKPSDVKLLTDRVVRNALEHAGDVHDNGVCPK